MTPQRSVLFALFLLSGFTGLIYESLWTHYLKLYLGHAAFAQSLVLAIFMGGMALGAWLVSLLGPRLRNLLMAYALAEAAIGAYALLFHGLFQRTEAWSFNSAIPLLASPGAVDLLQWGIAVALLLPPSIVLGATFPLMSGAVIRRFPGADGGNLAMLYFTNSIGAAMGVLVASFLLIGWLGLHGTLVLGGLINLVIAAFTAALARTPERAPEPPAPRPAATLGTARAPATPQSPAGIAALFFVAAFITGAASFIYEIGWIRMLSLVLGSSFHAFELMLSAFITGLALGSLAIRRYIDRIGNPLAVSAWIQIAMGLMAVLTLPVYAQSFEWMAALVKALPKDAQGWLLFNLASHGIAFAVMLPATVLAGMTLPLFTHVLLRAGHGERSIGRIYACNSLGAIAGVLFAIHIALPGTGLKLTLALGAMLDVALGLLLLRVAGVSGRAWVLAFGAFAVPLVVVRLVTLDPATLASGVYRTGDAHPKITRTLFYRDGKTATVSVAEYNGSLAVISTNGKPDAAIELNPARAPGRDEVTMVLLAALPLALRPDALHIANIGFGSGLTTHVALASPTVREVSTIEIEPAMVEGSRAFGPRVARAFEDPRSRIHFEDAKSWFARHGRRFDLIISEPSNPWISGVASLFSSEFYERIRASLSDDGLLVQWLNLYESDLNVVASMAKALDRHFPDYVVYDIDGGNLMFIAARTGRVPALSDAIFAMPRLQADLARVSVRTMDDLHFRWIGSKAELGPFLRGVDAPMNSDYRPYVEQNAPRTRFLGARALEFGAMAASALPVVEMLAREGVRWAPQALSPISTPRQEFVSIALEIHANLNGKPGATGGLRDKVADSLARLASCQALAGDEGLLELHSLAAATLAYLDSRTASSLWTTPTWLPCARERWPAAVAQRMALYQAVALRDAPAMQAAATAALAAPAGEPNWRRWALTAALLAHRVQGQDEAAQALWQQHRAASYPDGVVTPDLSLLLARR